MTALSTLLDPLKRELAVPGLYDDTYPDTDDDALLGALADGFSEAQLQGFFTTLTLSTFDADPPYDTSSDLSAAGGALVVMFTAMRIIRAQFRTLTLVSKYKAGPVEVDTTRSASMLRDEMAYMRARIDDLITLGRRSGRIVYVMDNYIARSMAMTSLGGFYGYEYGSRP